MGRKTKYTKEKGQIIIQSIQDGLARDDAARLIGINPSTLYDWMNAKPEFSNKIYQADAKAVEYATSALKNAIDRGDTKATIAWLQAKRPQEWGQKSRVEVANPEGETFKTTNSIDLSKLSEEQILMLYEMAEKLNE